MPYTKLDEKCLTILERLNDGNSTIWKPALYSATKPTQHKALDKRLQEMVEADLIMKAYMSPIDDFATYHIAPFGIDVREILNGANKKTLDILHFMQENHHQYFTPSDIAEKTGRKIEDVERSIRKLFKDKQIGWIGSRGKEGLYQDIW